MYKNVYVLERNEAALDLVSTPSECLPAIVHRRARSATFDTAGALPRMLACIHSAQHSEC